MTGRVFTKLFFSFVLVLFLGMVVLDFSLRQVMEQSLCARRRKIPWWARRGCWRRTSAHRLPPSLTRDRYNRPPAGTPAAAGADVSIFNAQGELLATSRDDAATQTAMAPEVAAVAEQHQSLARARRGGTLYVAVPAGPLVVSLAYPFTGLPAAVRVVRRGIVLASLLSLVVATLLAAWLAAARRQAPGPDRRFRQSYRLRRSFGAGR